MWMEIPRWWIEHILRWRCSYHGGRLPCSFFFFFSVYSIYPLGWREWGGVVFVSGVEMLYFVFFVTSRLATRCFSLTFFLSQQPTSSWTASRKNTQITTYTMTGTKRPLLDSPIPFSLIRGGAFDRCRTFSGWTAGLVGEIRLWIRRSWGPEDKTTVTMMMW